MKLHSGETLAGGAKLARTPIGTPRQAQPSSARLDASPGQVPYTAAKAWVPAPALGSRSEARTGRQLARTPVGLASAYNPALLAVHLADPQGTPGDLQQAQLLALLLCKQRILIAVMKGQGAMSYICNDLLFEEIFSVCLCVPLQHIRCMMVNSIANLHCVW